MDRSKFDYCHVVGRTDIGCKRAANEDNMGTAETVNGLVSVVCDGMGGHVGGATASKIAVETILEFIDSQYFDDPRICIGEAVDAANRAILKQASIQPELSGMGSTCVVLLVRDGKVYLGHVGDSRIYLIRDRRIKQLTKDHSFVQMLVDRGEITHEQAERHPRKNEITNALGIADMKPATIMTDAISPMAGDVFLLCSDGLSGMVSDKEIERVVSKQADLRAQERADLLVEKAKEYGGLDNITVQLVEFSVTPSHSETKSLPIMRNPVFWCGAAGLLAVLAVLAFLMLRSKKDDGKIIRETTTHVFSSVRFYPQAEVVSISYSKAALNIRLMEAGIAKDSCSVKDVFLPDSLVIVEGDVDKNHDNRSLVFKDTFGLKKLRFRLSNKERVVVFEIPVESEVRDKEILMIAEETTQQPLQDDKPAHAGSEMGNVALDVVVEAANDTIKYMGAYAYQKDLIFFYFKGGDEDGYCEMSGSNRVSIRFPFTIMKTEINLDGVRKEEGDNAISYQFGDIKPSGDIKIIITGKKGVDRGEDVISTLEFVLKAND